MNYFETLQAINVNGNIEKKGKFSYLSWPFAFAELFKRHPKAEIDVAEFNGFPAIHGPKGWMVKVTVTVDGIKRTQWHPVLDNNNRSIAEPDVFQINTSIQRAAVKAIALHGLGLYIYAGEDLPEAPAGDSEAAGKPQDGMRIEDFPADMQQAIHGWATEISEAFKNDWTVKAAALWDECDMGKEAKVAIWSLLDSRCRSAIKKEKESSKEKAA